MQSSWVTTAAWGALEGEPGGRGPHTPFSKAPETGVLAAPSLDLRADWEGRKQQAFGRLQILKLSLAERPSSVIWFSAYGQALYFEVLICRTWICIYCTRCLNLSTVL